MSDEGSRRFEDMFWSNNTSYILVHFMHTGPLWAFILPRCSIWMAPGKLKSDCVHWEMLPPKGPGHLSFFQSTPCVPLVCKYRSRKVIVIQKNLCEKMLGCLWHAQSHWQLMCTGLCCLTTSACWGTLFEQDWQSLICPDQADSEVSQGFIYFKLKLWKERKNKSHTEEQINIRA